MRSSVATLALATLALIAATAAAAWSPARADVVDGSASPAPHYLARGATEIPPVGPLSPTLQSRPVVARIHADWCIACKATQATIDDLRRVYAGKITFVEFDVTNARTAAVAQKEAELLGLAKFYDASRAATSTVAIIEPKDGKVVAAFYNDSTLGDYQAAIDTALGASSHS